MPSHALSALFPWLSSEARLPVAEYAGLHLAARSTIVHFGLKKTPGFQLSSLIKSLVTLRDTARSTHSRCLASIHPFTCRPRLSFLEGTLCLELVGLAPRNPSAQEQELCEDLRVKMRNVSGSDAWKMGWELGL
ncbi:hypothetical protein M426DRAFT_320573 [Hypoxylon sp. CI-4A]|nr:hypothetical protein M426DRAFT_320573 [Hypoxylon sp. CI-4A]